MKMRLSTFATLALSLNLSSALALTRECTYDTHPLDPNAFDPTFISSTTLTQSESNFVYEYRHHQWLDQISGNSCDDQYTHDWTPTEGRDFFQAWLNAPAKFGCSGLEYRWDAWIWFMANYWYEGPFGFPIYVQDVWPGDAVRCPQSWLTGTLTDP